MADANLDSKKGKRFLQERRLVGFAQPIKPLPIVVGFLGAGALGVGTYGRWLSQPPSSSATPLLVVGVATAAYFAWQLSREAPVVCVGDAGVAVERGSELVRLLWCDMDRIRVDQDHLVLSGTGTTISVAESSQALAISWILKEAAERLPKLIDVTPSYADRLPKPEASNGTLGPIMSLQTTGRRCAKSRKVIRYERDARICSVCTQVYLKDNLPDECVTCGKPLEGNVAVP
jgi:hypothetical protein